MSKRRIGKSTDRLPKLCGADIELGNFILGLDKQRGTGEEASRALLREIQGLPIFEKIKVTVCECDSCRRARKSNGGAGQGVRIDPQDWGRKFLPTNGGCAYIDLDHLELCIPEVLSAYDHVACWNAMLRIARRAMDAANGKLPDGQRLQVLINNSDGRGNSYGSHLNFLVTRRTWDNIFRRKLHYLLYLAAFQASSIVYSGQGKVGSENDAPEVEFQLSQRADFFERLVGVQTTWNRPIVNSRDEALCGNRGDDSAPDRMARLHVIFFDNTLCQVASLLKVGVMQIVLSMIEAEATNPGLILDDPVEAVGRWSRDPSLKTRARMASGEKLTAVELQLRFLEDAKKFVARGRCDATVPRVHEIIALWEDTLLKLQKRDLEALASRIDWVLKLLILKQVITRNPKFDWDSPQIKHLDHLYSSLDPAEGLYWAYERDGVVERVVSEERIGHFESNPPEDTRAWTRTMLLRWAGSEAVDDVDWDSIRFKVGYERYRTIYRRLELSNPLGFTKETAEQSFELSSDLEELLDSLGAQKDERQDKSDGPVRGYFLPASIDPFEPGMWKPRDEEKN